MTTITRPVRRETAIDTRDAGKRRPIVLTLYPGYLEIGLKGTRRRLTVAYDAIWALGVTRSRRMRRGWRSWQQRRGGYGHEPTPQILHLLR